MKKLKDNWVFELSITTILLGLMCYAAYSLFTLHKLFKWSSYCHKYEIYDYDNLGKVYTMEGIELMKYGLTLPLPKGEKAMRIMFEEAK